jgi:hypothetical protein
MAATLYAFKIKSVLFQRDFSLEFEAYVSKQNPYFFAAKEPTLAKLSHNLTMRESYTLRAKFTANAPEFIANVGRGVVALSIDACMPDTGLKSHYKLLGPMDVVL